MTQIAHCLSVSPAKRRRTGSVGFTVPRAVPFRSIEQAWHWTMAALSARRDGTRRSGWGPVRPCDPDDIVRCLDQLYRNQRIGLRHARVLRVWGERQGVPDANYPSEREDAQLWREALDRLEWPLRIKGIIV